jgi:putative membrane protein
MEVLRAAMSREHHRRMPPREIVDRTVDMAGASGEVDAADRIVLTTIAHFAFGALAGAVYGATLGSRRSSAMKGVAYGVAVWALAYGVGLPSLGLHPVAADDTEERNVTLIASHVVWGATLGTLI